MEPWMILPESPLHYAGAVSAKFREIGCDSFRGAARHVHLLPYGRTSDRADFSLVLPENRGTCSTKHALLAAVALEQNLPVSLTVGIYDMNEANTPGVGGVLSDHGLESIPEAHCYLTCSAGRADLTHARISSSPIARFDREWEISPSQIGTHKQALHHDYLREWLERRRDISMSFEELWCVREACILSLGAA